MSSIATLFSKKPKAWSLRGDPYLWDALGWELSRKIAQYDSESAKNLNKQQLLSDTFQGLTHAGEKRGEELYLPWLPSAGMSGGVIHIPTWNERILPELWGGIESLKSSANKLEYHPAEHRFRFATWAAATAARSSRRVCTFKVSEGAQLLRKSKLRWMALGSHWLPRTRPDFDRAHIDWCNEITNLGKRDISNSFTFGIAAKLVNCYLKALFLQTMVGQPFDIYDEYDQSAWDASTRFLHPPIDSLLMAEAARRSSGELKKSWKQLEKIRWSKFTESDYRRTLQLIRSMVGDDVAQVEACWIGYQ